jgi:hypothetical protein
MPDELKGGRFVLLGPLGEGAQGRTFDGVDKREGGPVAIKRFDVRGARAWKDVELAEREARVLSSLSHPRLPRYVDHFEEGGALYLVMEKIEGESLASIRKRGGSLAEEDVVRLLRDAGEVLAYLHGRAPPVIHRDLKPGNVIRRPDGSFAFVDFGAVRDKLRPEGGSTVVGTFGFMAPEQFQGRALAQSDVYAIGATAITMLTGREPEDLPHRGLSIDVRGALRGRASGWMIDVLERMLDPNPDTRARSIAPLLERRGRRDAERGRERDRRSDPGDLGRRAERRARKAARRAERAARRFRRGGHHGVPWPFLVIVRLALTAAILATAIATQVLVPLVLRVLSIVFGRPLREAADAVRDAGEIAIDAMRGSRRHSRDDEGVRVRVEDEESADGAPVGVRVGEEIEEDAEEDEPERRANKR